LPEDVQNALTECGQSTQSFVYEYAAQLESELLSVIEDAGVEVNIADKNAFIEASKPIYEDFASSVDGGQELIDTVLGLATSN
jgi:TRAP-type C4-dicarboxylate transport system substrate-binding protein